MTADTRLGVSSPDEPIRAAVVDVGSNSVRVVVFDGPARAPDVFFNEKVLCGLGADLRRTGRLSPAGRERALSALDRFARLLARMDVTDVSVVATAAARDASNGPAFVEAAHARTGWRPAVLSGAEEARRSALGVLFGIPDARGWVVDMGGASVEVARVEDGAVLERVSLPLGPLSLGPLPDDPRERTAYLRGLVDAGLGRVARGPATAYLVGGSARALARVDMVRSDYPLAVLHQYVLDRDAFERTRAMVRKVRKGELRARTGISAARLSLLPAAAEILSVLFDALGIERCVVSSFGLREGTLFDRLPEPVRGADPLLVAARAVERRKARVPGAGARLADFVAGAFPDASPERRRWIRAACHLADASWRAHPDYRHEVAFDDAMRANFGGIPHEGRVFVAVALYHRYRKRPAGRHADLATTLLDGPLRRGARTLGRAMRLWSALGGPGGDPRLSLVRRDPPDRLELLLPDRDPLWSGDVVDARLRSLAEAAGCEVVVRHGAGDDGRGDR